VPDLPWHLINVEKKLSKAPVKAISIQTARGCPFSCTFCSHKKVTQETYRGFSPKFILDNIEPLIRKYDITHVDFFEPHFISNPKRVEDICNEIIKRKLKIAWTGSARANTFVRFTPHLLNLMRQSGCERIGFGFESGSSRVLERIDKRIKPSEIIKSVELCKEYGIIPEACFMVGFPFESVSDTLKTLAMVAKLREVYPKIIVHMQRYVPFPNTILYDECKRDYNLEEAENLKWWGDYKNIKQNTPWLNPFGKFSTRALSGTIYISDIDYLGSRDDIRFKGVLSRSVKAFYKCMLPVSSLFNKEFLEG
jgi:radical SAM superfamily enzyme YgiQ (UPF0313 family)